MIRNIHRSSKIFFNFYYFFKEKKTDNIFTLNIEKNKISFIILLIIIILLNNVFDAF